MADITQAFRLVISELHCRDVDSWAWHGQNATTRRCDQESRGPKAVNSVRQNPHRQLYQHRML